MSMNPFLALARIRLLGMRFPTAALVIAATLMLVACARPVASMPGNHAPREGRYIRLAQFAVPPVEPQPFEPEQMVDDGRFVRKHKAEPIFGAGPRQPEPELSSEVPKLQLGPTGRAAVEKIVMGATLRREYPGHEEHHIFPQQRGLKAQFEGFGIVVDHWTILVNHEAHVKAHEESGTFGPGGRWNWDWSRWLARHQGATVDDVVARAAEMIATYTLGPYGLPLDYRLGRRMSQDLYDIVEPPRELGK